MVLKQNIQHLTGANRRTRSQSETNYHKSPQMYGYQLQTQHPKNKTY